MKSSSDLEVLSYFRDKAKFYDDVEHQVYWRLSDTLLWEYLTSQVLAVIPSDFSFLDAGCGTGRWGLKILESFPTCKGSFVDFSPEMLAMCRAKLEVKSDIWSRSSLRQENLSIDSFVSETDFDVIICFHNVLGFIQELEDLLRRFYKIIVRHGRLVVLAPNLYHAIYFALSRGDVEGASDIAKTHRGRFVPNMPAIRFFKPEELKLAAESSGFAVDRIVGFPSPDYAAPVGGCGTNH